MHPIHTFPPYFPNNIHSNLIIPSTSLVSSLLVFRPKFCIYFSFLPGSNSVITYLSLLAYLSAWKHRMSHWYGCGISCVEPSGSAIRELDLNEMDFGDGKWIELAQDCFQWRNLVLAVLNLRVLLPGS
jgi:hypothetical protein